MNIDILQAKITTVVTRASFSYDRGSVTIGSDLMEQTGIIEYQKVDVNNKNNMSRITTYVITGKPGELQLNGAAARFAEEGDVVHINAYCSINYNDHSDFKPIILNCLQV